MGVLLRWQRHDVARRQHRDADCNTGTWSQGGAARAMRHTNARSCRGGCTLCRPCRALAPRAGMCLRRQTEKLVAWRGTHARRSAREKWSVSAAWRTPTFVPPRQQAVTVSRFPHSGQQFRGRRGILHEKPVTPTHSLWFHQHAHSFLVLCPVAALRPGCSPLSSLRRRRHLAVA
jgi:hypothetical protein